ncbi:MAG: Eco47II family restriction endonuclease [Alphaproteobacteria bacterium]
MTKPYNLEKVENVLRELFFDRWQEQENNLYENNLDPFSAVLSSAKNNMSIENWFKLEETRQTGSTDQNNIGELHQKLISCFDGVEDLGTGGFLDTVSVSKKIIAEIKNKHNTTKGNHKREIYDDISSKLSTSEYKGFTGYYVEVIPKRPNRYNKPFTPSDNRTKTKRPLNEKIRVIDGISFYDLISGQENTLKMLFNDIIKIINKLMAEYNMPSENFSSEEFKELFDKVFFGSE